LEEVSTGIIHVVCRVPWYNFLVILLYGTDFMDQPASSSEEPDDNAQKGRDIRLRLVGLYKAVLAHLMSVSCAQTAGSSARPSLRSIRQREDQVREAEVALQVFGGKPLPWHASNFISSFISNLPEEPNDMYRHILSRMSGKWLDPSPGELYYDKVLVALATAHRPLRIDELQELVELPKDVSLRILTQRCTSLLEIEQSTIFFRSQAAKTFVMHQFNVTQGYDANADMALNALRALSKSYQHQSALDEAHVFSCSQPRYARVYWAKHFADTPNLADQDKLLKAFDSFFDD
jgi:hypothetical protein